MKKRADGERDGERTGGKKKEGRTVWTTRPCRTEADLDLA